MQLPEKISATHQTFYSSQLFKEIYELTISMLGECEQLPLPETVFLINSVLIKQLSKVIELANDISEMRQSKFLDIEDFLFLFRNDTVIVRRLLDFLRFKKSLKNIKAEAESSNAENSPTEDTELLLNNGSELAKAAVNKDKLHKKSIDFLKSIDTRNTRFDQKLEAAQLSVNQLKQHQLKRMMVNFEKIPTREYEELINLRTSSFKKLSSNKFEKLQMLTCSKEIQARLTTTSTDVIGFLFRELLTEFIEIIFIFCPTVEHMASIGNDQVFEVLRLLENSDSVRNARELAQNSEATEISASSLFKFSFFYQRQTGACALDRSKNCLLF